MSASAPERFSAAMKAAVPVGAHEDMSRGVHDDLPVLRHSGPHPLGEEEHVLRVEPEVIVLLEAADRRLVVRLARHHVERDRAAVADRAREDLARVEVEERRARDGPDGVAALRPVVAEARTLPARDEQRGDAAGLQLLLARGDRLGELFALEDRHLRRLALRAVRHLRALRERALAVLDALRIDRRDLLEERGLFGLVQLFPIGEDVLLAAALEPFFRFSVIHVELSPC